MVFIDFSKKIDKDCLIYYNMYSLLVNLLTISIGFSLFVVLAYFYGGCSYEDMVKVVDFFTFFGLCPLLAFASGMTYYLLKDVYMIYEFIMNNLYYSSTLVLKKKNKERYINRCYFL